TPAIGQAQAAGSDGMLVQYLGLDDVKCFQPGTTIDLRAGRESPHKWVVVYGDNGLGKSTLLRALGIALTGQPALNVLLPSAQGWPRSKSAAALIQVSITKGPGDKSPGASRQRVINLFWNLFGASSVQHLGEVYPAYSIHIVDRFEDRSRNPDARRLHAD